MPLLFAPPQDASSDMTNARSLLVIVIWFGLAIAATELVSQLLSASQVGRTAPRKPGTVATDTNVGELAFLRSQRAGLFAGASA